jgi:hypothetical protein
LKQYRKNLKYFSLFLILFQGQNLEREKIDSFLREFRQINCPKSRCRNMLKSTVFFENCHKTTSEIQNLRQKKIGSFPRQFSQINYRISVPKIVHFSSQIINFYSVEPLICREEGQNLRRKKIDGFPRELSQINYPISR